ADSKPVIDQKGQEIATALRAKGVSVKFDQDDNTRPGWKFAQYELQGVPVRLALGLRDLEQNQAELARRDTKEKMVVSLDGIDDYIYTLLDNIQQSIFDRAKSFRDQHITKVDTWEDFVHTLENKGGFI